MPSIDSSSIKSSAFFVWYFTLPSKSWTFSDLLVKELDGRPFSICWSLNVYSNTCSRSNAAASSRTTGTSNTPVRDSIWRPRFTNAAPSPINQSPSAGNPSLDESSESDKSASSTAAASLGGNNSEVIKLLKELQNKVEELSSNQSQINQQKKSLQKLPKELTGDVHHVVKALAEQIDDPIEWDFTLPFTHKDNKVVVMKAVINENVSSRLAKRAVSTYFATKKRQYKSIHNNQHRGILNRQRKRQRKHNKLRNRKMALHASTTLSAEEKRKLVDLMTLDYMSSEDTASGSDEDNNTEQHRTFVVRPLQWVSEEAKAALASLDRKANRRKTERGKEMMVKRKVGMPSLRNAPEDCPDWAKQ